MGYIVWNPDGTVVDLGFYVLRWYSILFALGFVLSYIILRFYFKREGVPHARLEDLTVYVFIATVVGARLGHCLFYDFDYYSKHITEIFLPFRFYPHFQFVGYAGLASHGGVTAILIAVFLYSRKFKIKPLWVLDKLALVGPLAGCCIRVGNLMNSEIVGKPASLPWAFIFVQVDPIPRHPGQLYEALVYLTIFIVLNASYLRNRRSEGFILGIFLILLFSARFFIEFLKADQSEFEKGMLINMGQILSIPFIVAGILLVILKRHTPKPTPLESQKN